MPLARAVLVWLLLMTAESVQGVLRTLLLAPLIGDFRSRQLGVLTGSLLILIVAYLTVDWLGCRSRRGLLAVGLLWVGLTVGFELLLGRLVLGLAWRRIAEDYDLTGGGLLPLGLAVLAAAPLWAARLRRRRQAPAHAPPNR